MKILFISQHFYPEQFKVNDICFELAESGHDVTVLTGLPNYPSGIVDNKYKWFKKRNENIKGVNVYRTSIVARGKGIIRLSLNYLSFAITASIKSLFLKKDFDLIIVYQTSPVTMAVPGMFLKAITKKPLIIYCHDLWPESIATVGINNKSIIYKFILILSKWIYNSADEILTSSRMFKEYFENKLGIYKKTTYLPVYAEELFEKLPSKEKTEREIINLVFAGNVGKMQSVETILLAANEIKDNDNIIFHIVGDGSSKIKCEKIAKEYNLKNVVFHGQHPISSMPQFYDMADAFLITLRENEVISYTIPNKVQSYLAAGKPLIGAINGETQMLIKEEECGLCAPAEDFKELANKILEFSENVQMHSIYGLNGRKYYENNFSKSRYFKNINSMLKEIKENGVGRNV